MDEEISSLTEPVSKFIGKMTQSFRKQSHSYPGVPETLVCEYQGDNGDENLFNLTWPSNVVKYAM